MSTGVAFTDADDLLRWASVVSWRVAIDARRRSRLSEFSVPDRPDHVDVAQAAEHRIVLSALTSRFKELPARDREILLTSFDEPEPSSRRESVRLAVARHRARTRLRRMLEGLAAPVWGVLGRRRWRSSPDHALVATTVPVVTCIALAVTSVIGGSNAEPPRSVEAARPTVATTTATTVPSAAAPVASTNPPTEPAESAPHASPSNPRGVTAGVHVDDPVGGSTDVGARPRRADDHLACVTLPSMSGLVTTCVDPPPGVSS